MTVANFVPLNPPLNPRLTNLHCHVDDGLAQVHRCLTTERLRATAGDCRTPYSFEQHCGCDSTEEPCCDDDEWCRSHSPYRFVYLAQKAQDAAARVSQLGNALLSAFDRGDAEYLGSMRARHEAETATTMTRSRSNAFRAPIGRNSTMASARSRSGGSAAMIVIHWY